MRFLALAVAAGTSVAVAIVVGTPAAGAQGVRAIAPRDPSLRFQGPGTGDEVWRYEAVSATGEATVMPLRLTRHEEPFTQDGRRLIRVSFQYDGPLVSADTLVALIDGLVPVQEVLHTADAVYQFEYDGAHVAISTQRRDSAAQHTVRELATPAFPFNQGEMVMRALPLEVGYHVLLPLFSEIDQVVEVDTVTVESGPSGAPQAGDHWLVRFADGAEIRTYEIEAASRRIVSVNVVYRRNGRRSRLVRVS